MAAAKGEARKGQRWAMGCLCGLNGTSAMMLQSQAGTSQAGHIHRANTRLFGSAEGTSCPQGECLLQSPRLQQVGGRGRRLGM